VRLRQGLVPVLRALAAAITLGSGASLGPEGPSVDIGRSAARALGSVLRSKHRRLLPLIAAGSGAGAPRHHAWPVIEASKRARHDMGSMHCNIR
jgi:H+/Cl- antiporter ClcA